MITNLLLLKIWDSKKKYEKLLKILNFGYLYSERKEKVRENTNFVLGLGIRVNYN